ncbi:heavy metal-associated isoprenylated plant protein 35-like [Magnolia sinica]|uniref:heavy metal-associated isoprenylated plant protein 35-like n=1 Tax=Magnolia sinica TaxID=86752 RepID=UPI00265A41FB|nr:heavy metal-associated isoprenylated plant protein 35-like [Magnolia sinica]
MAKEGDLKRVELKVSVNCCEGCKRKVKKTLQSISGVLETQIDGSQPKVTVIGKVDSQILIKKLGRVGKSAEIWPNENQKTNKEEKKAGSNGKEEIVTTSAKDKDNKVDDGKKSGGEKCSKCSTPCNVEKSKGSESGNNNGGDKKGGEKDPKKADESHTNCAPPEVMKKVYPPPQEGMFHDAGNIVSYPPYYYPFEPSTVPLPYYTVSAYTTHLPYPVQDRYYLEVPVSRLMVQPPGPRLTEYFNDENTSGCSVM